MLELIGAIATGALADVATPSFWATVGNGVIMGIAAALAGWTGNGIGSKDNAFDLKAIGGKVVVGAVIGIVAALEGVQFDTATEWFLGGSAVLGASKVGKAAWENVLKGVIGKIVGGTVAGK